VQREIFFSSTRQNLIKTESLSLKDLLYYTDEIYRRFEEKAGLNFVSFA
jgi:hypothetical protein